MAFDIIWIGVLGDLLDMSNRYLKRINVESIGNLVIIRLPGASVRVG